jgi:hypothetical protein
MIRSRPQLPGDQLGDCSQFSPCLGQQILRNRIPRGRRVDRDWRHALPEILERESAFLGLAQPITRVIICAQGEFDTHIYDAWRAEALAYRELALAAE